MTGGWVLTCAFPFCDAVIPAGVPVALRGAFCPLHRDLPPMPPSRTAAEIRTDWRRDVDDGVGIARTHATDVRTLLDAYDAAEANAQRSADAAVDAARELGHVAAAAVTRADAAEDRLAALAGAVRAEMEAETVARDAAIWVGTAHDPHGDLRDAAKAKHAAARAALDALLAGCA